MYIARLQLKDFKSFGGSHELPFAPGMTAIVGPNGSGKSNILDSIRWALGDSHSSKLRVAKQEGLIFHGSASRPKGAEASVTIQLREGSKISLIRRRIAPESGTVVTVDGNRVTLTELDAAKREWQLGGGKFAFIGQGDVAEVIQQRPQARRLLLESLFGIDAYRRRRDEASARLGEAREEYTRLRTFSAELRARYDEIAPEAGRARAARELLDALLEYRKSYYWVRRKLNDQHTLENEEKRRRWDEAAATKRAWLSGWDRSLQALERDITELSNSRQNQVRELDAAREIMTGVTRTAYGYGASVMSLERRLAQTASEREEAALKLEGLRKEDKARQKSGNSLRDELERRRKALDEATRKQALLEERFRSERERAEAINRERGEIEGGMAAMAGRIKSLGLRVLESRETKNDSASADPLKAIRREMEELERRHVELLDEQERVSSRHRDVFAELQGVSSDLQRNRRELSKMSNRLSELHEQAASEVYPRPVQHVMSAVKLGRVKANIRAVIDAFECPSELAVAMEAFLGMRQFMLLTDTIGEAGLCIEILKKNQMGRATFLPLERSRSRSPDHSCRLPDDGIAGWAMDLVKAEIHWRPALEHIMGDLLIVDDYSVGQGLVRAGFRFPIATLEGDVFQPGGTISGGRAAKSGRAMEIMSAVSRLETETDAARRLVDSLSKDFSRLEEEEAAAAAKKDEISREIRDLASRRSACDASREDITRERARAKNERESILASLKEHGASYLALFRRLGELREEAAAVVSHEADLGMMKEIEGLKTALAVAEEKNRSGFVLAERMASEIKTAARRITELDDETASAEREILTARTNLSSLARRYAEAAKKRRRAESGMDDFKERYDAITAGREKRALRRNAAYESLRAAETSRANADVRTAELASELTELMSAWEEQYPYPGPDAAPLQDPDELRRSIRECDRSLKAMGEVDMGALSEERSLKDRLAFLGEQLDDVGGGIRELERLISDADEQARGMFTNALDEIDKKFNALFQRLFTGGDARLEMIEGESLWDSGVDVLARPPGKHPASIAQLSGGEQSLSAIALLFASLEVASSPIAVLDEVDAALDEVNLRRFADLARDASKERQILVMTHRRLTMERADVLYGVTLAEPGLSRVIGVRVEDWA